MSDRESVFHQKLDNDTVRRWRSEAITAPAQDSIWLNRCEVLCNALLDAHANLRTVAAMLSRERETDTSAT